MFNLFVSWILFSYLMFYIFSEWVNDTWKVIAKFREGLYLSAVQQLKTLDFWFLKSCLEAIMLCLNLLFQLYDFMFVLMWTFHIHIFNLLGEETTTFAYSFLATTFVTSQQKYLTWVSIYYDWYSNLDVLLQRVLKSLECQFVAACWVQCNDLRY